MLKFSHVEQNLSLAIQELTKEESSQVKGGDHPGMGPYSPCDGPPGGYSFKGYFFSNDGQGSCYLKSPDGTTTFY